MLSQLKQFTVNLLAGANVAIVVLMLASGFADHVNPASHALLSCMGMTFPFFLLGNLAFLVFWTMFKWRKLWIPIAGFALAMTPIHIYMPLNATQEVPEGSIRLITYNVEAYSGYPNYNDAFGLILDYVRQQQPDILCFQEDMDTWRKGYVHYDSLFAYRDTTRLGYAHDNALGIYTRFPILRKERMGFDSKDYDAVAYYLKVGHDTIIVLNTHLEGNHLTRSDRQVYNDLIKGNIKGDTAKQESRYLLDKVTDAAYKRAPQADAVHRYVDAHRDYPLIVCGDFNDNPISYSRRTIAEGLTDCFVATGRGIGLSYNQKGFFFRIDHILCSSHFEPYNCQVDSKIDFSDHYPVSCWFKLKDNS